MKDYRSEKIKNISAYVPGEQPKDKKYIKLNTNECPYPPSPIVKSAIIAELDRHELALYPDPECTALTKKIAANFNLESSHVFIGNGSDEILAFCFPAFFEGKAPIAFADITYSFYPVYSALFGIKYRQLELDSNWDIPVNKFCEGGFGGILIANPNAPTGKLISLTDIETILKSNSDCVVILDEAYIAFGGESAVPLIFKYPNLLVVQTFSKAYALAGMRVGYAMGNERLIEALNTVKNSFNSYTINRLSMTAAAAAIGAQDYYKKTIKRIEATRERTAERLRELGFLVLPSKANFIFAEHSSIPADVIAQELRLQGVLVRHFNTNRIKNFLRISIGTEAQMETFCEIIGRLIKNT